MSTEKTERTSGLAIAGLILAILAILGAWVPIFNTVSFIFAIVALVFGIVSLVSIKKGKRAGRGLAIAAIVISVVTGIIVLATQSFYGKVADEIGSSVDESFKDLDGTNTDKLLETSVDVTLGEFTVENDGFFDETSLPVTIKNKASEKASYSVQIEAVDDEGARLADDTVYVTELNAGQSTTENAFVFVESGKVEALKSATFKVLKVSKS